jgi:hypothetical protein
MSEMVERLAEFFEKYFDDHQNEWPVEERPAFDCQALARAAIAAMREPTQDMITAGIEHHEIDYERQDPSDISVNARDSYRAMLDAALKN